MELRTFIKQALLDIVNGIQDAQKETETGTIVPQTSIDKPFLEMGFTKMQVIDFEIAVRVDESTGKDAKIGVVSGIFNSGVSGKTSNDKSHESKIRLKVPVQYTTSGKIGK
jgi:inner membrane protein involved in colicin E2 resistance